MNDQTEPPHALADHATLAQAQSALNDEVAPAAYRLMDAKLARAWLLPFWQNLIRRSAHLPYRPDAPAQHAAPMLLHIHDWPGAQEAVADIESWRRIPCLLYTSRCV